MERERPTRNPYVVGLGVAGGIAGALAVILAATAARLADEYTWTTDTNVVGADVVAITGLYAWADRLGMIAVVAITAALVVAGFRWTPKASAADAPPLSPPGGLTEGERRLLGGKGDR